MRIKEFIVTAWLIIFCLLAGMLMTVGMPAKVCAEGGADSQDAVSFALFAPDTIASGEPFYLTVRACDSNGNTVTDYTGNIAFEGTAGQPGLPTSYTFKASDNGVKTFSNVVLNHLGPFALSVYDQSGQPDKYWKFDEGTGTVTADSVHATSGTLCNTNSDVWVNGTSETAFPNPKAIKLDGSDDYLNLGPVDLANRSFTIAFWAKRSRGGEEWIISQGTGSDNQGLHIGFRGDSTFSFAFWGNDLDTWLPYDTNWHHWAVTYNTATKTQNIFQDGNLLNSRQAKANLNSDGDLVIGKRFDGYNFGGSIDDLRVYHRALYPIEIKTLAHGNRSVLSASKVINVVEHLPQMQQSKKVAAGYVHSLALKADGTVVAWGARINDYGQCDVPGWLRDVVAIDAGVRHSLALQADGTVVAWGGNDWGQCNVPAGLTDVVDIAAGGFFSMALKADGTIVAWGHNGYGQLNVPAGLNLATGRLRSLQFDTGTLTPAFNPNTDTYTLEVDLGASSLSIMAFLENSNAALQIGGLAAQSGDVRTIALNAGQKVVPITVSTHPDGMTRTYTLNVVRAAGPASFQVNVPAVSVGEAFSVNLTALRSDGQIETAYTGNHTINWNWTAVDSPNGTAPVKPESSTVTFTNGLATVSGFKLTNAGTTVTITATDENGSAGTSPSITVNPGNAASMVLTHDIAAPAAGEKIFAGQPQITLQDVYGNICTNDSTTVVTVVKKDAGDWVLTGTKTATASNGVVSFTNLGFVNTLAVEGAQLAFTASGLTGIESSAVNLAADTAARTLVLSASSGIKWGEPFNITVEAKDYDDRRATGFRGQVSFQSSDPLAVLPEDYTFTEQDAGIKTFSVTFNTIGDQSLIVAEAGAGGLLGYWKFDEGSGTQVLDASGNGYNGTLYQGLTWRADDVPAVIKFPNLYALQFDGFYDFGELPIELNLANKSFSVSFWAKVTKTNAGKNIVVGSKSGDGTNRALHIGYRDDDTFTFAFYSNDLDADAPTDAKWHHWAATYNVSNGKRIIYCDGVNIGEDNSSSPFLGTSPLCIGRAPDASAAKFGGSVDDLRIFDRELSADEVAYLAGGNPGMLLSTSILTVNPPPAYTVTAEPASAQPTAGGTNTVTLTVKQADGSVDPTFNGEKSVMLSGYTASPKGTYGSFNGTSLAALPQPINVNFINGAAQCNLVLHNASAQNIRFSIEGVFNTDTNPVAITPVPGTAVSLELLRDVVGPSAGEQQFSGQPELLLKDAYGNACVNDNTTEVTAARKDSSVWVLTGTGTVRASEGIVKFTDLGFVSTAPVTGAKLGFSGQGLSPAESGAVSLPGNNTAQTLVINAPSDINTGIPFDVTVKLLDAQGELAAGFCGTIHFESSDANALLPEDYTFKPEDHGSKTFSITLRSPGAQTLAVETAAGDDIQGYWRFDEGTGNTAGDSSAGNRTGGFKGTGTTWSNDIPGIHFTNPYSIKLSGENDYIEIPSGIDLENRSFSICFWAKRDRSSVNEWIVFQGTEAANKGLHIGFNYNNDFRFAFYSDDLIIPAASYSNDTNWHHWTLTYDSAAKTQKIFQDGVLRGFRSAGNHLLATGPLIIGKRFDGNHFKGNIDDLHVYYRALSEAEVSELAAGSLAMPYGKAEISVTPVYTVTYHANDGSGTAPTETDKAADATFTAAANTFSPPEGKQFKHWNTEPDGTGTTFAAGEQITMPASSLDLYAIWGTATGTVTGRVTDGTNPIAGADVSIIVDGISYSATTNADGSYSITDVPIGEGYTVTASKPGFTGASVTDVRVTESTTTSGVNITLTSDEAGCLVTYRGAQTRYNEGSDTYDIRLIATIDTLNAKEVGFVFSKVQEIPTRENASEKATTTVYEAITASGMTVTADSLGGRYIIACTVTGIPKSDIDVQLHVRAFSTVRTVTKYTPVSTVTVSGLLDD